MAEVAQRVQCLAQCKPVMGITGFTEWFLKTFPRTVVPVQGQIQPYIDHVFIDMNQFVHKAARTAKSYDMLWKRMYRELDNILNVTNPRQSVYIVMDGPGTSHKSRTSYRIAL